MLRLLLLMCSLTVLCVLDDAGVMFDGLCLMMQVTGVMFDVLCLMCVLRFMKTYVLIMYLLFHVLSCGGFSVEGLGLGRGDACF